jgi:hypothetical protein
MRQVALLLSGARRGGGGGGGLEEAQRLSWEARASKGILQHHSRLAAAAARGSSARRPAARLTALSLMSDIEEIPVKGTRYDDGCDRAAGCGKDEPTMWVPKGAKYLKAEEPDTPVSAEQQRVLDDVATPELTDVENPPATHTEEVEDITSPAAGGCDDILDLDAWLACEEARRY